MPIDQNEVLAQKPHLAALNQANLLIIQMEILLQEGSFFGNKIEELQQNMNNFDMIYLLSSL